jgi:hypothetical protein
MGPAEWYRKGMPKRCNVEVKCYPRAQWEIDAGMSPERCTPGGTRSERFFCDKPPGGCNCNAVEAHQLPASAKAEWMKRCPGCSGQIRASEGLQHSEKLGGFVGPGMAPYAPDARTLRPGDPTPPTLNTNAQLDPRGSVGGHTMPTNRFNPGTPSGGGTGGPGGQQPGGWVDTGLGIVRDYGSGWGSSKCKGPFNDVNGQCVPKPPSWGGWANYPGGYAGFMASYGGYAGGGAGGYQGGHQGQGLTGGNPCPTGFEWNGAECVQTGFRGGLERFLPGGETGMGMDVYGEAVMGAFGKPAIVPATSSQPTRHCPPGTVLGKDNLCYAKGSISNQNRKWPRAPRPVLSSADMKTIRKAKSLQNRVKKAATVTGFSCRKR